MKNLKIETWISILFCVVIMPLILMLAPLEQWLKNNTVFLIVLILYMYSLYFIYKWAKIPRLFMQKKYGRILLLIVSVVLVTRLFTHFPVEYDEYVTKAGMAYRQYFRSRIIWFFFLIVTSFSLAIELTVELFRQTMAKKEMESQKKTAELALYKAQINPHFLFNTLNSIYSMILTKSDKTEDVLIKFSNILKYMYSHVEKDSIPLGTEMDYIRQYVDLQSLRLNGHTKVLLDIDIENEQKQIPSMILITFIENVFKYGISSVKDCTVRISIHEKGGILVFTTENEIMRSRKEGTGIGIENCRKRLEAIYGDRFHLDTSAEGNIFRTELEIQLI